MKLRLLAMLILASWARVKGDETLRPEPSGQTIVVGVGGTVGGKQQIRQITLTMPAPPARDDEEDVHPPAWPGGRLDFNAAVVEQENFERWLFPDEQSEEARQRHLNNILGAKIENISPHKLTGPQRAKLQLAGRGDIKRFFDRVQDKRRAFEIDRKTFKTGLAALRGLDALSQVYQEGPFGAGSLFAKTLHRFNDERKAGH
jgi:hypothetical protein